MSQEDDADVLRIMVSTDNHLGVWERDEWRCNDSFEAFEEVFLHAKDQGADMVLLGGDLFHDNKPSRSTLVKCLDILNRHCLSDDPISFQVVSDPALIQSGVEQTQDPNLNVGLPCFTIHGNHDDPAGPENLSAIDILSTIRYVNYFGKHLFGREDDGDVGKIRLSPLLLQKRPESVASCNSVSKVWLQGETKVALYGLGFLREERLARCFQIPGQVGWTRPSVDTDEWFNVFVLHQNRVQHHKTGPNNKARNIQDGFLPHWLDIVVWGHEHECKPSPEPAATPERSFSVLQPGSSVATSLSEPESKPKYCFMLDICRDQWRITEYPLRSVRPFKFKAVSLKELGAEPGNHKQIEKLLIGVVEDLIAESLREQSQQPTDDSMEPLGPEGPADREAKLPLIRVRVDYSGYTTIHSQRFGQMFVNKVANPQDIILWAKSSERKARDPKAAADASKHMPDALDNSQIEDLIAEFAGQLEILPAQELGEALKRFVEKDEKHSLQLAFDSALKATQDAALQGFPQANDVEKEDTGTEHGGDPEGMAVVDLVHAAGQRLQAESVAKYKSQDARLRAAEESAQNGARSDDDMAAPSEASDDIGSEEAMPPPGPKSTRGKGRGRGRAASTQRGKGTTGRSRATGTSLDGVLRSTGTPSTSTRTRKQPTASQAKRSLAAAGLDSDEEFEAGVKRATDAWQGRSSRQGNDSEDPIDIDDDVTIVGPSQGGTQRSRGTRASPRKGSQQSTARAGSQAKGSKNLTALWGGRR